MPKQVRDGNRGCSGEINQKYPPGSASFPSSVGLTCSFGKAGQGWDPVTLLCVLVCRALLCLLTGALCPAWPGKELGAIQSRGPLHWVQGLAGFSSQRHGEMRAAGAASCLSSSSLLHPGNILRSRPGCCSPGCTIPGPLSFAYLPYRGGKDNQASSVPCNQHISQARNSSYQADLSPRPRFPMHLCTPRMLPGLCSALCKASTEL